MSLEMSLWHIDGNKLAKISKQKLDKESRLEKWIYADSSILGIDLLIIGRQVKTTHGGLIDLLAIDENGNLAVLELKKAKTPRDIVAQVLDYASWVNELSEIEINEICLARKGEELTALFSEFFAKSLPETINESHKMIIIASELDNATERIVQYLANKYMVNINVILFNYFQYGSEEFIGRSYLLDPTNLEIKIESTTKIPWSGFWYFNVGEGDNRNWEDCRKYGFMSAGQGPRWKKATKRLKVNDKVFAYLNGHGYVGLGVVKAEAVRLGDFYIDKESGEKERLIDMDDDLKQPNIRANMDDEDRCEYLVKIDWTTEYDRQGAKKGPGIFVFPGTICQLRDDKTIRFLKREFKYKEE